MPETSQEVYHCPNCGALGKVDPGEEKVCGECGFEFNSRVVISPRLAEKAAATSKGGMVQRNVRTQRRAAEKIEPVVSAELLSEEETSTEIPETSRYTDEIVSDEVHRPEDVLPSVGTPGKPYSCVRHRYLQMGVTVIDPQVRESGSKRKGEIADEHEQGRFCDT